jgi:hypothetical protein
VDQVAAALDNLELHLEGRQQLPEEHRLEEVNDTIAVISQLQEPATTENGDHREHDVGDQMGVGTLFCAPLAPQIQQPAMRRPRQST